VLVDVTGGRRTTFYCPTAAFAAAPANSPSDQLSSTLPDTAASPD